MRMSSSDRPIGNSLASQGANIEGGIGSISHHVSQSTQLSHSIASRGQVQHQAASTPCGTDHTTSAIQFGSIRPSFPGQGISSVEQQTLGAPSVSGVVRQQYIAHSPGGASNTTQFSRHGVQRPLSSKSQEKIDYSGVNMKGHGTPFSDLDPIAQMNQGKGTAPGSNIRLQATQQRAIGSNSQLHGKPHSQYTNTPALDAQRVQDRTLLNAKQRQHATSGTRSVSAGAGGGGSAGNEHGGEKGEPGSFSSGPGSGKHLKRQGSRGTGGQHSHHYQRNRKNEGGGIGKARTKSRDFDDRDQKRKG